MYASRSCWRWLLLSLELITLPLLSSSTLSLLSHPICSSTGPQLLKVCFVCLCSWNSREIRSPTPDGGQLVSERCLYALLFYGTVIEFVQLFCKSRADHGPVLIKSDQIRSSAFVCCWAVSTAHSKARAYSTLMKGCCWKFFFFHSCNTHMCNTSQDPQSLWLDGCFILPNHLAHHYIWKLSVFVTGN